MKAFVGALMLVVAVTLALATATAITAIAPHAASLPILGSGNYCLVVSGSEVLLCDYVSYASCVEAGHGSAVCVPRPGR